MAGKKPPRNAFGESQRAKATKRLPGAAAGAAQTQTPQARPPGRPCPPRCAVRTVRSARATRSTCGSPAHVVGVANSWLSAAKVWGRRRLPGNFRLAPGPQVVQGQLHSPDVRLERALWFGEPNRAPDTRGLRRGRQVHVRAGGALAGDRGGLAPLGAPRNPQETGPTVACPAGLVRRGTWPGARVSARARKAPRRASRCRQRQHRRRTARPRPSLRPAACREPALLGSTLPEWGPRLG